MGQSVYLPPGQGLLPRLPDPAGRVPGPLVAEDGRAGHEDPGAGASVLVAGSAIFGDERPWDAARRIREAGAKALSGRQVD